MKDRFGPSDSHSAPLRMLKLVFAALPLSFSERSEWARELERRAKQVLFGCDDIRIPEMEGLSEDVRNVVACGLFLRADVIHRLSRCRRPSEVIELVRDIESRMDDDW